MQHLVYRFFRLANLKFSSLEYVQSELNGKVDLYLIYNETYFCAW